MTYDPCKIYKMLVYEFNDLCLFLPKDFYCKYIKHLHLLKTSIIIFVEVINNYYITDYREIISMRNCCETRLNIFD